MNATAKKSITRQITSTLARVAALPKPFLFALLNGRAIQQMLDLGQLVTINTVLDELGGSDLRDGFKSWAGRHIASCYRLNNGGRKPIRAWVRHRTTGRWIHVFVYVPGDAAIEQGLRSYNRTAHLVPVRVLEAA